MPILVAYGFGTKSGSQLLSTIQVFIRIFSENGNCSPRSQHGIAGHAQVITRILFIRPLEIVLQPSVLLHLSIGVPLSPE